MAVEASEAGFPWGNPEGGREWGVGWVDEAGGEPEAGVLGRVRPPPHPPPSTLGPRGPVPRGRGRLAAPEPDAWRRGGRFPGASRRPHRPHLRLLCPPNSHPATRPGATPYSPSLKSAVGKL